MLKDKVGSEEERVEVVYVDRRKHSGQKGQHEESLRKKTWPRKNLGQYCVLRQWKGIMKGRRKDWH